MTKKGKRKGTSLEEALARPWCYYCERDFDDLKILINHQRAKHYKCDRCQKRLNTAGGLAVHMTQVHKETLEVIENAIPGRESVDVEIFGMEGIPEPEMITHRNRIMAQVAQEEQDRRIQAGQPGSSKKPKIDKAALDPEEIKRRLAEHKKAIAEGGAQPGLPVESNSPVAGTQSPAMNVVVQSAPPQQGFYSQPPSTPYQFAASQPPSSVPTFPPSQGIPQYQVPQFSPTGQFNNGYGGYPNGGFQPQPPNSMPLTPQQSAPAFGQTPYQPPHQAHHPPPIPQGLPQSVPGLPPRPAGAPGLPPRPSFSAPPPPMKQTPSYHSPPSFPPYAAPNGFNPPSGSNGYGPPPGLPPMPHIPQNSFNAPPSVSRSPLPAQAQHAAPSAAPHPAQAPETSNILPQTPALVPPPPTTAPVETSADPKAEAKEERKDVKKEQRLVWSDNEVSPEEKRAMLARYAFTPSAQANPVVLGA